MRRVRRILVPGFALCLASGIVLACPLSGGSPRERLHDAIEDYRRGEGDVEALARRIEALFARMDADLAELRADAAVRQGAAKAELEGRLAALEAQRKELEKVWFAARLERLGQQAGKALESAGEAVGEGLEDAGRAVKDATRR